ncbi:uncharacterized protein LOC115456206 isoform X2 [Manduca sexta]|uniref:uncharacterized protein LOC115456206 isoform X2 n=1 Tax=Manduca sexta TaxID=7130 RepID=UPI00188F350A|nr:uncharacterized protein LOC115456206 isoform X2 [Manduca sexta]
MPTEAKKNVPGGGDAPQKDKKGTTKGVREEFLEVEEVQKSPSQIAREEAEYRALMRKRRFKRRWPEITKVKINTRPWFPPPPPQRLPTIEIELPPLTTRKWVPPYRRRRRRRPKLLRIPAEEMTQPLYECAKLKKIWHNFVQVERNKMMLQGSLACNTKRYSSTACGSQTGCIAAVCRALLDETPPDKLCRHHVDEVLLTGDSYYHQCLLALKCYKGKPQLQLNQLLTSFYFHDTKYTVKMVETERGLLAKHPDNIQAEPDLMTLMEKKSGSAFMFILSIGGTKHFLIWGEPATPQRSICYIFDPHMLDSKGRADNLSGAAAFLRYAGITSFVLDFLSNYGDLDAAKKGTPKPPITLTTIEVVQREPLLRQPDYGLDLKALKLHCRSEWESINVNALIEKKRKEGMYPQGSLSAVSVATSRATAKNKVKEFYQKTPKEPPPQVPVAPERPPPGMTTENIMSLRGEDFFLYCPSVEGHTYGRDDMLPRPKSETLVHSPVDIADQNYHSQYHQLDVEKWILRATRHMASYRYQTFKWYTGLACCLAALAMLRRMRARAWNEDTLDETLDLGYNIYRESVLERGGPIRQLVLGEHKETFRIRDTEYMQKVRGVAVWGNLISPNPKVFDLCRGIEAFFKESDAGILQVPGEYEVAIWHEGGKYYMYHPWPADRYGSKVGLRDGGKACLVYFTRISRLCDYFLDNANEFKRKPFSISEISITERKEMPEPVNQLKPVAPGRWVIRGRFHEGDGRFPEEHRNKQATAVSIAAIAMAHLVPPADWTPDDIDETLIRGDILYQSTVEHLERMGISLDSPREEEEGGEEEESSPSGGLAAVDVLNRFKITDYDCISTEVLDSAYNGDINAAPSSGVMSLKDSLAALFREHSAGVVTARGASLAVFKRDQCLYMFDPHGCDENGYPSEEPRAGACLIRVSGGPAQLAGCISANLPPAADDSFNLSPVSLTATKLNAALGAPETELENKAFEWISKGTAAILMGPRGENTAIGKIAERAGIPADEGHGREIAPAAAAAFAAAAACVPPSKMHRDHVYCLLDAGAEYYLNHVKKTGRKELQPEDLTEKFEMGANTFWIELADPIKLPLRLPDEPAGEGGEEGGEKEEYGEELEEEEKEEPMKQIKDALNRMWLDETKPYHLGLLLGDYHQLGVWMKPGGSVVAYDPAPTLARGVLTSQRIKKGDELRLQRIKDEMAGEDGGGGEEAADEEAGAEGEEQPEPEPEFIPPDSSGALMVFASPTEFIDKLTMQGGLDRKQCLAPYKLYPVNVKNELTSVMKEKKGSPAKEEGEAEVEDEEEVLVEALDEAAVGNHFNRIGRTTASVRGRVAQGENYFMEQANRDRQDAANSIMGIVVEHIEPYIYWKPQLIDAILKYGDRLHTLSLSRAADPPHLTPAEIQPEFHVTNFNVRLEVEGDAVIGDIKAGETGSVLSVKRGIKSFFETYKHGVFCSKNYCVGIWMAADDKSFCLWEPHSVGPGGKTSPGGSAAVVLFSNVDNLAQVIKENIEGLGRPGVNKFCISAVKVFWEFSKMSNAVTAQGAVPDEGYEWKVLTAYVEMARGRTILRGTRPPDPVKFSREAALQSSCGAIVGACVSHVRRPHLWTARTVDQVMTVAGQLFSASLGALGYEFRPGEDVLLPLQVLKRFILGVNYVRYELESVYSGKLEQKEPSDMTVRCALERFFESHTHGILWSVPLAVAVWRCAGAPPYYMLEPHACGPTGLRADGQDDGAACVMTFTSSKLMAYAYLQNVPVTERPKHDFQLYAISVTVQPIKKLGGVEPPLVQAPPGVKLVPATSKVGIDGSKRRASEGDRKHPPGSATCLDAQRASENRDREMNKPKGQRNTNGWLVMTDGTQYLSAQHSIACRRFPYASRGHQALACCVMAVAMSRVEDVCRWCSSTLDQILDSGDQLHQDSCLHFKPRSNILTIEQVLRKFYTPGNCVCRVVVFQARHKGIIDEDLLQQLTEFFREEKSGVLVAGDGTFAVALFRTPRGYYMFDPADRDRYGRAVAPPCIGRARACFSQFPNVQTLAEKLCPNVPPMVKYTGENDDKASTTGSKSKEDAGGDKGVHFEEPATFSIYGMDVTSLRRLNQHER